MQPLYMRDETLHWLSVVIIFIQDINIQTYLDVKDMKDMDIGYGSRWGKLE